MTANDRVQDGKGNNSRDIQTHLEDRRGMHRAALSVWQGEVGSSCWLKKVAQRNSVAEEKAPNAGCELVMQHWRRARQKRTRANIVQLTLEQHRCEDTDFPYNRKPKYNFRLSKNLTTHCLLLTGSLTDTINSRLPITHNLFNKRSLPFALRYPPASGGLLASYF